MGKLIWSMIFISFAYFSYSYIEKYRVDKARNEAHLSESKKIEQATRSAVAEMVSRTGAIDNWVNQLSKGNIFRADPILTIELEKLWLRNKPILFIGTINDIATHDKTHYKVSIERSFFNNSEIFNTELQLSLLSEKQYIDSFLERNSNLSNNHLFSNGVAVIADLEKIRTAYASGEKGERVEVKIADGKLIDVLFIGNTIF